MWQLCGTNAFDFQGRRDFVNTVLKGLTHIDRIGVWPQAQPVARLLSLAGNNFELAVSIDLLSQFGTDLAVFY